MVRLIALWAAMLAASILALVIREERLVSRGRVPTGRLRRLWFGPERRRAPRYRIDWPTRYHRPPDELRLKLKTRDLSRTGVGLVVQERLEVGSSLQLELTLPKRAQALQLLGQVRWAKEVPPRLKEDDSRTFFIGVQFLKMDPALESELKQALGGA